MQGEIYPYSLLLQQYMSKHNVQFFCQDIICKYWPWVQRLLADLPTDHRLHKVATQKPFLSVMHSKAHSWSCQVLSIFRYEFHFKSYFSFSLNLLNFHFQGNKRKHVFYFCHSCHNRTPFLTSYKWPISKAIQMLDYLTCMSVSAEFCCGKNCLEIDCLHK